MVSSKGFKEVFRPWLEDKIKHSWLDPRKVTKKDDFFYEYAVSWAMAQSADQILKFVDDKIAHAEYLEKKEEGKEEDIRLGE